MRNAHAFITFYHLLPPNILVCPPNIFDKFTPVRTNLGKTKEKGITVVNLGAHERVNQHGKNRRQDSSFTIYNINKKKLIIDNNIIN